VSARVVPYYCPYCGEEDLRLYEADPDSEVEIRGGWHCADCTRVFAVKYHGMAAAQIIAPPPSAAGPGPE
jgi:transposase-like protein